MSSTVRAVDRKTISYMILIVSVFLFISVFYGRQALVYHAYDTAQEIATDYAISDAELSMDSLSDTITIFLEDKELRVRSEHPSYAALGKMQASYASLGTWLDPVGIVRANCTVRCSLRTVAIPDSTNPADYLLFYPTQ